MLAVLGSRVGTAEQVAQGWLQFGVAEAVTVAEQPYLLVWSARACVPARSWGAPG